MSGLLADLHIKSQYFNILFNLLTYDLEKSVHMEFGVGFSSAKYKNDIISILDISEVFCLSKIHIYQTFCIFKVYLQFGVFTQRVVTKLGLPSAQKPSYLIE